MHQLRHQQPSQRLDLVALEQMLAVKPERLAEPEEVTAEVALVADVHAEVADKNDQSQSSTRRS